MKVVSEPTKVVSWLALNLHGGALKLAVIFQIKGKGRALCDLFQNGCMRGTLSPYKRKNM